jgi:hypothetical protein
MTKNALQGVLYVFSALYRRGWIALGLVRSGCIRGISSIIARGEDFRVYVYMDFV